MNPIFKHKTQKSKVKKQRRLRHSPINVLNRLRTARPIELISGFSQLFTGLTLVILSIAGFIKPLWIASLTSVIGSTTTMIGAYILFEIISTKHELEELYKSAIKRILYSKN